MTTRLISLKHPKDYEAEQGACFEVHFEKSRGFCGEEAKSFIASISSDDTKNHMEIWKPRGCTSKES